jgi:hypothetical protein
MHHCERRNNPAKTSASPRVSALHLKCNIAHSARLMSNIGKRIPGPDLKKIILKLESDLKGMK